MAFLPEVCDPRGLPSPRQHISGLSDLQVVSTRPSSGRGPGTGCGVDGPPLLRAPSWWALWPREGRSVFPKGLLSFLRLRRGCGSGLALARLRTPQL